MPRKSASKRLLDIRPITLKGANAWISDHHRHSGQSRGHKFSLALWDREDDVMVGAAIVGRPIQRNLDDGRALEVLRVAVFPEGHPLHRKGACSALYGAACRAAFAMGYVAVYTYTLRTETGRSLHGAGFVREAEVRGRRRHGWTNRGAGRTGGDERANVDKWRWVRRRNP